MATSCAENSVVEVFESSLDYMYSSSVDSPSTCTTKTSHSSSLADPLKKGDTGGSGTYNNRQMEEKFNRNVERMPLRRCTRSLSTRAAILRSSKSSSHNGCNTQTDDARSSFTSSSYGGSSDGVESQLSEGALQKALQYAGASNDKAKDLILCQWCGCSKEVNFGELLDHLTNEHIRTQLKKRPGKEKPTYVCRWVGCKVYGKPSTLHSWLERHVVCHLGNKPFRCIVDHCGMRFSSQFMLNRHINGHFPKQKSTKPKKMSVTSTKVQKVFDTRRKSKHPRLPPAVSRDFCDSFTMSCIQRYITNFCQRTQVESNHSGQFITFRGVVVGRRTDFNGIKSCLIRWLPLHILPDEWLPEHQVPSKLTQVLPLSSVPGDVIKFLMCDW